MAGAELQPCITQPGVALGVVDVIGSLIGVIGYLVGYRRQNGNGHPPAVPKRRPPASRLPDDGDDDGR